MKKMMIVLCFFMLSSLNLFTQTSEREPENKFKYENFTKTQISSKTVELAKRTTDSFIKELTSKLRIAKKQGNEIEARRIEKELNDYKNKNRQTIMDSSKIRRWQPATDVEIEYNNSDLNYRWGEDIFFSEGKAPSMAVRYQNGDKFWAFEDDSYTTVIIRIVKYEGATGEWTDWFFYDNEWENDYLFPCVVIGEGNQNKLFVSFYSLQSQEVYVYWKDLNSGEYDFVEVQTTGENVRPRICVDTDPNYYVYVAWVEEDWPSGDDLYYSRSTDYGESFCDGVNILGGVYSNIDIGWGNNHLYIVYQGDAWPGKIYLIENSPYGDPSSWPNSGFSITDYMEAFLYPRIAVSDHNDYACVVYTYCYSDTDYDIFYSYTHNGNDWDILHGLESGSEWESLADIYYMHESSVGDNFHIAYYDDGWIKYRDADNPSDWNNSTTISDNSNASDDDFIAVCANSANDGMVAWVNQEQNGFSVWFDYELDVNDNSIDLSSLNLQQNFPNPFNPVTTISFDIKEGETGKFEIYNLKGQKIASELFEQGSHSYIWNAEGFASGVYFYKLQTASYSKVNKMLLLK